MRATNCKYERLKSSMSRQNPTAPRAQIQSIQQSLAAHQQTASLHDLHLWTPESKRTPGTPARDNLADIIEEQMRRDGQKLWALVIYRCDYESNARWEQCSAAIRAAVEQTLREFNGLDLLSALQLIVMDDAEVYNGLNPSQVREHFKQWSEQAIGREQGRAPGPADYRSPRYTFCAQIDSPALDSIIQATQADPEDGGGYGYVNVISAVDGHETGARPEYLEELGDENFDTGWMSVSLPTLVDFIWHWVGDTNAWWTEYRPPPKIHHG